MKHYIELQEAASGDAVHVKPGSVEMIQTAKVNGVPCAKLHLSGGSTVTVDDDPATVRQMIAEAGKSHVY